MGFCVAARVRFPYEFQVGLGSFEEFTVSSSHGVTRRHGVTSKADKPSPRPLGFRWFRWTRLQRHQKPCKRRRGGVRSHLWLKPFLVQTCTVFFPVHERFLVLSLSRCLQPSFVVSHPFSWHVRAMERMCQFLRYLPPLRIWVAPDGPLPDLEGTGYRASTMEEKINEMFVHIQMVSSLAARFTTLETNAMSVSSGSDIVMACGFLTTPNIHE